MNTNHYISANLSVTSKNDTKRFNTEEIHQKLATDRIFVAACAREHFADYQPLQNDFLFACLNGDSKPFLQQLDEEADERAELEEG